MATPRTLDPIELVQSPIVGLVPVIGNALLDATNVRFRSLPLIPQGLKLS